MYVDWIMPIQRYPEFLFFICSHETEYFSPTNGYPVIIIFFLNVYVGQFVVRELLRFL